MKITVEHHYDAKVDEVVRVMTDEAELRAKFRESGHVQLTDYERTSDGPVLDIRQTRTLSFPVPDDKAKLLVPAPRIRQSERWESEDPDGVRRGTVRMTCPDLPVAACAQVEIVPSGIGTCTRTMTIEFTCTVPAIGGRIVAAVVDGARELIEADHLANVRMLRGGRR